MTIMSCQCAYVWCEWVNIALRRSLHNHDNIATEGSPVLIEWLQGFQCMHSTIDSTAHFEQFGALCMHNPDDKHSTRPRFAPKTSEFRVTTGANDPSGRPSVVPTGLLCEAKMKYLLTCNIKLEYNIIEVLVYFWLFQTSAVSQRACIQLWKNMNLRAPPYSWEKIKRLTNSAHYRECQVWRGLKLVRTNTGGGRRGRAGGGGWTQIVAGLGGPCGHAVEALMAHGHF